MRCSTSVTWMVKWELGKRNVLGHKHSTHDLDSLCSQNPPSQPPWPDLRGSLCSGSFFFFFPLFVQAFPGEIFSQLTPCWCLPHSRCSINISSLFLTLPLTCHLHPCYSILPTLLSLPFLPIMLGQSKYPSFETPAQAAKVKGEKRPRSEPIGSNSSPCCVTLGKSLSISGLDDEPDVT